ncbi:hypothetical protein FACS1894190_02550 [Spirochaetia bacterium]|nr:hypothetical protein FACS1894190_02550 [Spirochaetia bacterium]
MTRIKVAIFIAVLSFTFSLKNELQAENVRVQIIGNLEVSGEKPEGISVSLFYTDSALIQLNENNRFIRGVELELTAPQNWISNQGSLAFAVYSELDKVPKTGTADLQCKRIIFQPIPAKIQSAYQIPLRLKSGLRSSPFVTVHSEAVSPNSFPVVYRIVPIVKGLNEDVERMRFSLNVKPVFSDEGAVRIIIRYPENLTGAPISVLIDDTLVENPAAEQLIREGEHQLSVISSDYRNENRRFIVERGKSQEVSVLLHDLTPFFIFEAPANAQIFLDNNHLPSVSAPLAVEPGTHEVRIQLSDYTILKTINVQKGKTYRIAYTVDMEVIEE